MERQRTLPTFLLGSLVGMGVTLGLVLAGEALLVKLWPERRAGDDLLPYLLVALNGLAVGVLLTYLSSWRLRLDAFRLRSEGFSRESYYPSLEGFLASLAVAGWQLHRDGWQVSLDSFVELLLRFEAHFASLCFAAFLVFLARGGGLFYPMFVGLRYLRFKMITGITVVGVALGVAGLTVVLSVMSGFESDLKAKIVGTNAHAMIQKRGLDFTEYRTVLEKAGRVPGVVAASPFVYNEVMVTSEYNLAGVFIKGIDPATATAVQELKLEEGGLELLVDPARIDAHLDEILRRSLPPAPALRTERPAPPPEEVPAEDPPPPRPTPHRIQAGRTPPPPPPDDADADEVPMPGQVLGSPEKARPLPGILIGKELKKILKVRLGERVNVVSPLSEELGPSGPVPKARAFRVAGVFYTGMYEYDAKSIYVTLSDAQEFFGLGDAVTGIALRLKNIDRAGPVCQDIVAALDGYPYFTRTWYQMNKNLFSALKLEKVGMFIVLIIVILVSAFGIISTLIMLVWEKVKEIAILKSMGATGDGVMKIFMIEGMTIGLVGTLLGLVLGFAACVGLTHYGLQLDPEVYYIEAMPVNMDPVEFVLIAGIALHISLLATVYPSRRASRLRPAEGLRYE